MSDAQISLFSETDWQQLHRTSVPEAPLSMSRVTLAEWKQRIADFQKTVVVHAPVTQGSLFEATQPLVDAAAIDPFALPQQNTVFWRWRAEDQGIAALYFVIDYDVPLLLYVGETVKSNQRWKGEHDCKRYLLNYRQAHYQLQLPSSLGIAFWRSAPPQTRLRQRLESDLIYKWRSPFNKENWTFWGTPFVGSA